MKRFRRVAVGLSAALVVACGSAESAAPTTPSSLAGDAKAKPNGPPSEAELLARMRTLDVLEVSSMIVDLPANAYSCYGLCPGYEDDVARAKERAVERLLLLVEAAEQSASHPADASTCEVVTIDANLEAIRALEIVDVRGLVGVAPDASPHRYRVPGECERAGKLANLVAAARHLEVK